MFYSSFYSYLFQTVLSIATAVVIRSGLRKSAKLKMSSTALNKKSEENKKEVSIFVTFAIMQIGFTLTISKT